MNDPIDRRSLLRRSAYIAGLGTLALSGSGLLAACSGSSNSASLTGPLVHASAGVSTGRPKRGGSLTVGTYSEDPGLNPVYSVWDWTGILYGTLLYDVLGTTTPDAKVVPYLAKSIDHSTDYMTWTVTLRRGVKFHDGSPLTAEVVAANWQTLQKSPASAYSLLNLATVSASGPLTVTFSMHKPWVPFDAYLATTPVVHPKMLNPNYKGNPIGTGPYIYQEWVPGTHLIVNRNPSYWREGLPYLDQVTVTPIIDSQQRANALQAGTIEIMHAFSTISDLPQLRGDSSIVYRDDSAVSSFVPNMAFWILNCAEPPTNDLRIRQAMAYASDQTQYSQLSFSGMGSADGSTPFVPVTSPFAPGSPWYAETSYPKAPDMAKAKQLVASYAKEHGTPTVNTIAITVQAELAALQVAQSQWEEAGIKVNVTQMDVSRLIANTLVGNFHASYWSPTAVSDPDVNYPRWSPSSDQPIGTISAKPDRLKDSRIQPLLDQGRSATTLAARAQAYQSFAKAMGEDIPYIYMGRSVFSYAARPNLQNWANPTTPEHTPAYWTNFTFTESWLG